MNKWQESRLKYVLVSKGEILDRESFNEVKKELIIANKALHEIFEAKFFGKFEENEDYIDELTYENYFEWIKDYHKKIEKLYFDLIHNINKVTSDYFDNDDKTFSAQEVKKILSENNIYNLDKGFGNISEEEN